METSQKSSRKGMSFFGRVKEFFRKLVVALKRKPQTIPLLVLAAAFVLYSFNLTSISKTTARINFAGMGLAEFCTMLFSLLSFVCFLNAFPHRKKPNLVMLLMMFGMLMILIFCDIFYIVQIVRSLATNQDNRTIEYILKAKKMLIGHAIVLVIGAVLTALVPVIRKLLSLINTNPELEEAQRMDNLVLSEE